MTDPQQPLRITLEDLAEISKPEPSSLPATDGHSAGTTPGGKSYGNINAMPEAPILPHEKPSILLQAWFYLGAAGLLGALAGWGIAEPRFVDGPHGRWGNTLMIPLVVTMSCIAFAVAESIVERSTRKALIRGGLALPLGMVLGFVFNGIADIFYSIALGLITAAGVHSYHNPAAWLARGIAWVALGAAGGVVYGIIGQSMKRTGYGVLGGAIGAAVGGMVFDPISFATHAGGASRAVGFGLLGLATGVAIGLVESALKDRWLYVTAGPLAGKQFILYKQQTAVGSAQSCDIYLFKDPEILPQHALLELKGSKVHFIAQGPVYIGGQPVRGVRVLENGAVIQLGRYGFRYQERQR
jgi:hypothetical protein